MEKLISLFVIVSLVCHLVAANAETTERLLEYRKKILVPFPTFFKDNFFYALCKAKLDDDEVPNCRITRKSNIFEKNTVTNNCDLDFKMTNETENPWKLELLGPDHAVIIYDRNEDIVIVRFEDCLHVKSSTDDSRAAELNETLKELGIYPDVILKGGYGVFYKKDPHSFYSFDRKGNAYWYGLYERTSYASEARNLLSQNTSSKYRFYNKHAELKSLNSIPVQSWYSLHIGSAAHDYFTIYIQRYDMVDIEQFDQDGKIKVTYPTNYKRDLFRESVLATYNLPEGGFYLLTMSNTTNTAHLTKVNSKGEGTHVLDVDNVHFEKMYYKRQFKFYEKVDRELCLSWVYYDLDETTGMINWFTRCFEGVKIFENFWEKTLSL